MHDTRMFPELGRGFGIRNLCPMLLGASYASITHLSTVKSHLSSSYPRSHTWLATGETSLI